MKAVSVQVVSCCVYVKSPQNYALHAWQHSILVWLLGQSICSSPSTKELHGLNNFLKVLVKNFLKKVAQIFGNFCAILWAKTFPIKLLWAIFWATFVQIWASFNCTIWSRCCKVKTLFVVPGAEWMFWWMVEVDVRPEVGVRGCERGLVALRPLRLTLPVRGNDMDTEIKVVFNVY